MTTRSPEPNPSASSSSPDPNSGAGASMLMAQLRGGNAENGHPASALSAKPKRFSSHNTVTGLVLFVSAIMLYGMRQAGMRSGMSFKEVKIDYQREEVSPATMAAQRRILLDLQRSERPAQIPSDRLAKNPFELGTVGPAPLSEDRSLADAQRQAELARQATEERRQKIQTSLAGLQLRSVMEGRVPIARINEQTCRIGDTVGEVFTVTRIDGRSVELTADGQTYTLAMADKADPSSSGYSPGRGISIPGQRPK
jgi:hypothetical protein